MAVVVQPILDGSAPKAKATSSDRCSTGRPSFCLRSSCTKQNGHGVSIAAAPDGRNRETASARMAEERESSIPDSPPPQHLGQSSLVTTSAPVQEAILFSASGRNDRSTFRTSLGRIMWQPGCEASFSRPGR